MMRTLREQAFLQFESERNSIADQLGIVVGGECRATGSEGIADAIRRKARAAGREQHEQDNDSLQISPGLSHDAAWMTRTEQAGRCSSARPGRAADLCRRDGGYYTASTRTEQAGRC